MTVDPTGLKSPMPRFSMRQRWRPKLWQWRGASRDRKQHHSSSIAIVTRRQSPWCGRARNRSAGSRRRRSDDGSRSGGQCSAHLLQYPGLLRRNPRFPAGDQGSPRNGLARGNGSRLPGACAAHSAGRDGREHRDRLDPERFGVPMGYGGRTPPISRQERRTNARFPAALWAFCLQPDRLFPSPRAANPRAAYPARESDFEHMHGPGSAGGARV